MESFVERGRPFSWIFLAAVLGCAADPPPAIPAEKIGPDVYGRFGVSLSGAEFGRNVPGVFGTDYTYPTHDEVDYYVAKGMTLLRIPFRWERVQPTLNGAFDPVELARLDDLVGYAQAKGAGVLLDPHNYARYADGVLGTGVPASAFADFWSKLALHYQASATIDFGLMNEPHDMATEAWLESANAAIQAIRATGATNLIMIPGNGYDTALGWHDSWYGKSNAEVMLGIVDPGNNYAFEVHQYLDSDGSGTSPVCVTADIGSQRISRFTAWLRRNHMRGFLGEFGGSTSEICLAAVGDLLGHLQAYPDVYLGWTWWGAGPWWHNYMFSVEPSGGADQPQMGVLLQHLGAVPAAL
jgi:endoglucanase